VAESAQGHLHFSSGRVSVRSSVSEIEQEPALGPHSGSIGAKRPTLTASSY